VVCEDRYCRAVARRCEETCSGIRSVAGYLTYALDKSCRTVDDCVLVGGAGGCGCAPSPTTGSGVALSKDGAADPTLQWLVSLFERACRPLSCTSSSGCQCDAPPAELSVGGHGCPARTPGR